jgi:hypothetical protein
MLCGAFYFEGMKVSIMKTGQGWRSSGCPYALLMSLLLLFYYLQNCS